MMKEDLHLDDLSIPCLWYMANIHLLIFTGMFNASGYKIMVVRLVGRILVPFTHFPPHAIPCPILDQIFATSTTWIDSAAVGRGGGGTGW